MSESLQLKRAVVKELDELSSPKAIIASNSSSFTITEIIDGLDLKHPQRCVNLHSCKCTQSLNDDWELHHTEFHLELRTSVI